MAMAFLREYTRRHDYSVSYNSNRFENTREPVLISSDVSVSTLTTNSVVSKRFIQKNTDSMPIGSNPYEEGYDGHSYSLNSLYSSSITSRISSVSSSVLSRCSLKREDNLDPPQEAPIEEQYGEGYDGHSYSLNSSYGSSMPQSSSFSSNYFVDGELIEQGSSQYLVGIYGEGYDGHSY